MHAKSFAILPNRFFKNSKTLIKNHEKKLQKNSRERGRFTENSASGAITLEPICSKNHVKPKINKIGTERTQKKSRAWSCYRISSFSWSNFEFIIFFTWLMFLMIPEASNGFKLMFFHALVIQGPSQIDPWSIWENHFFIKNFIFFEIFRWP